MKKKKTVENKFKKILRRAIQQRWNMPPQEIPESVIRLERGTEISDLRADLRAATDKEIKLTGFFDGPAVTPCPGGLGCHCGSNLQASVHPPVIVDDCHNCRESIHKPCPCRCHWYDGPEYGTENGRKDDMLHLYRNLHTAAKSLRATAAVDDFPEVLHYFDGAVRLLDAALTTQLFPKIVCLCGSTRFYDEFVQANYEETMAGKIVLSVGFFIHGQAHDQATGCTPEQKIALDELHKRKIDLADEVLILNIGGYIGESTRSEINYATAARKPIRYKEPING